MPKRGGLVPPVPILLDRIPARRVQRIAEHSFALEFDLPFGTAPGDCLRDPPSYWAVVVEGGEEPFVFRSVFSAALCRLDELPGRS